MKVIFWRPRKDSKKKTVRRICEIDNLDARDVDAGADLAGEPVEGLEPGSTTKHNAHHLYDSQML